MGKKKETATAPAKRGSRIKPQAKQSPASRGKTGVEAMQRTADVQVKDESDKIVKGLVEAAKGGNSTAARLLYVMTTDHVKSKEAKKKKRKSLADQWADEEEWSAEMSRPLTDASTGGVEPE